MYMQNFIKRNFGEVIEMIHIDDCSIVRGTACLLDGELALQDKIGWIIPNPAYYSHARVKGELVWTELIQQ